MELFRKFKEITQEEETIIRIIRKNVEISKSTNILDIGSNQGLISRKLQNKSESITLVDIEETNISPKIKFLKTSWENASLKETFELVLASHVWGHFGYTNTQPLALNKMLHSKNSKGKIILCYNTNSNFMGKLVSFSKKLIKDFQYDYFDEELTKNQKKEEFLFTVNLKAENFEELADLVEVLIIAEKELYKKAKPQIKRFLEENLKSPSFLIEQKIVILN